MTTDFKINLSDEVNKVIEELNDAQNPNKKTKGEIIAQAIAFYRLVLEKHQNGYEAGFIKGNDIEIVESLPFKKN